MDDEHTADQERKQQDRRAHLMSLPPTTLPQLEAVIARWLVVGDPDAVRFLCAVILANRLGNRPLWSLVIGPSGGGKSELVGALFDIPSVYPLSTLTPHTLISGAKRQGGKTASLIYQLDGKVLIFKDWTSVMSMRPEEMREILGQFREMYDGRLTKTFGTGECLNWEGKVGVIAAGTAKIEEAMAEHAALGERFLTFMLRMPDQTAAAMRTLENQSDEGGTELMQQEMRDAFYAYLCKTMEGATALPKTSREDQHLIVRAAKVVADCRSPIRREMYSREKEIEDAPPPEMPTRLASELDLLFAALTLIAPDERQRNLALVRRVALDTIPRRRLLCLKAIMDLGGAPSGTDIANMVGLNTATVRRRLEDLAALKILKRGRIAGQGNVHRWQLDSETIDLFASYDFAGVSSGLQDDDSISDPEDATGVAASAPTPSAADLMDELAKNMGVPTDTLKEV